MRTKVLLTAALGLVGAATVSAQVFSVNVVGYANVSVCKGYNLLANPLDNKAGNNVANLFPTPPTGLQIFVHRNNTYDDTTYDPDLGGWTKDLTLLPGEGFWLNWPGEKSTITFVGDVMQGILVNEIPAGYSIRGSMVPQAGKLVTDLGFPTAVGDLVYLYNYTDACVGAYWDSTNDPDLGTPWTNGEPELKVGQGFWIVKLAAATWTRDFKVN